MRAEFLEKNPKTAIQSRGLNIVQRSIFITSLCIVALTFLISPAMLNQVMLYTQTGGSFLEKFHPATWFAVALIPVLLMLRIGNPLEYHYRLAAIAFVFSCVLLTLRNKGALMATLVDIYFTPAILLAALSRLPADQVKTTLALFVRIAALNVLMVVIEFGLRTALFPREDIEFVFRPAGFFQHPIFAGTLFCCAMLLLRYGVVDRGSVRPLMLFFLFGTALCAVRGPLAVAVIIFLANILLPATPRRTVLDYGLDFGIIVLAPLGMLAGLSIGAFDRVLEAGMSDESSESRFLIFDALDRLGKEEIWWGVDSYDSMEELAKLATGGQLVENSFVSVSFGAGVPMALLVGFAVLFLHAPALRRSLLFVLLVTSAALTTLTFSSKAPSAAGIALAGYWIWRSEFERKRHATRRD